MSDGWDGSGWNLCPDVEWVLQARERARQRRTVDVVLAGDHAHRL
jgi:hypothetical protein